jgi:universal stress protein E
MERFKNLLAVVDDQAQHQVAVTQAARLAKRNRGKLKLVKVIREFGWLKRIATPRHAELQEQLCAKKLAELDDLADSLRQEDLPVTTKVLVGKSSTEIIREVLRDGHDIVLKQAKGLQGVNGFFGTTGLRLLRTCPCPVWLVSPTAEEHPHRVMAAVDATSDDAEHEQVNAKILI